MADEELRYDWTPSFQITQEQANKLLMDPELIRESIRTGYDLGMFVNAMLMAPADRWRKAYREACSLAEWARVGEEARKKEAAARHKKDAVAPG
jgi:hypothetical protein